MTAGETDVHSARVEAATNAMVDSHAYYCVTDMRPDELRKDARDVLAAADAVVTVEMIAEVVRAEIVAAVGECVCHELYTSRNRRDPDCGWHQVGDDFAHDTAKAVHRLYRGEDQSRLCDCPVTALTVVDGCEHDRRRQEP